ncbi:MAG: SDR family oxidoreductase [Isosphaeraceae bacterium]
MKPILVTGASGYIGGRLVPRLLEKGHRVRCLARDPRKLSGRGWGDGVEVVAGDVLDRDSLWPALAGCGAAYYLVHSMAGGERGFGERDRTAAENFADAAGRAGLDRVIYLGGLGKRMDRQSAHLGSRHEVGDILRSGPVPAIELRAAMIIGAGSLSFEMMRALVERLPVMICPRWVKTRSQPIAVRDVLTYLLGCLEIPIDRSEVFDIGGPEVLTYREMMLRFASIEGLKRYIIDVPVLTPRLSAYWVNMMTPVPAGIAFPLIEGLKSEMICEEDRIRRLIPAEMIGFDEAVRRALVRTRQNEVQTRWTNASVRRRILPVEFNPDDFPIHDEQVVEVNAPAEALFDRVRRVGGDVGWFYADPLWKIRGWLDRLIGGVGLRRGRRDPVKVWIGDAIDFWRVGDFDPNRRLLLHAEMKVPGDAWLEFRVRPLDDHRSILIQTAYFRPTPFWGRLYWKSLYPLHRLIFRGMARNLALAAEKQNGGFVAVGTGQREL